MVFEMLKQHLIEDDRELDKIYKAYKSGKMSTGELKEIGCDRMTSFLNEFTKNIKKAQKQVNKLHFITFA